MKKTQEQEVQSLESLKQNHTDLHEKAELLTQIDKVQTVEQNLSVSTLIWTYIIVFFTLLLVLPKIYIANQVYYISKDINKQYHKYTALREENRYFTKKIEEFNYQNQIVNDVEIP